MQRKEDETYGLNRDDCLEVIDGLGEREKQVGELRRFLDGTSEPQAFIAKVTSTITARAGAAFGTGVCDIVSSLSGALVVDLPTGEVVRNVYDVAVPEGQYVIVVFDGRDERLWAVPKGGTTAAPTSLRVRGTIKNTGSGSPIFTAATGAGPFTLEGIQGIDAVWAGAAEITIHNPRKHKVWADTVCEVAAEYNQTVGRWEVYDSQGDRVVQGVRLTPGECKFGYLNGDAGWRYWNGNEAGAIMDADWVKHVHFLGTELFYDKCSASDILVKTFQYVEAITWDSSTRTLGFDYNDLTSDTITFPNFLTNFNFNTLTCAFDLARWTGALVSRSFPDFVTDIDLSSSGSTLVVDHCLAASSNIDMPYLVDVSVVGSFIVREYADGTTANVIELTSCPP